ncbi:MAG: NHLP bacteriocin export ABC transporter permease/ATPase subunit [Clostridia bacterium]|nr:NHLP bacteriocin export ABC transporter permease/ATPase subunit [Clostridia bacterium]
MGWFNDQIRERMRSDQEVFEDSFVKIAGSVLGGQEAQRLRDERLIAKAALDEILKYYHYKPVEAPEDVGDFDEQLAYVLRPLGLMTRDVKLEPGWYRDAFGPMLGFLKEGGTAVALLPRGLAGYCYVDPATGKRVSVNRGTEDRLSANALCFYRPLPMKKLGIPDLLMFMKNCISKGDIIWIVLATLAVTLVGFIEPRLSAGMTGPVLQSRNVSLLAGTALFLLSAALANLLIGATRGLLMERISTKTQLAVESSVMMRVLSLPVSFFRKFASGELSNRASSVGSLCDMLLDNILSTGLTSLSSLLFIFQIFTFAPALVLPSVLVVLATFVLSVATSLAQVRVSRRKMLLAAKESGMSYALVSGIQKIRLSGAEKRAFARWADVYAQNAELEYNPPTFLKLNGVFTKAISLVGTIVLYYMAVKTGVKPHEYYGFSAAYGELMGAFTALAGIAVSVAAIRPVLEMAEPILKAEPEVSADKAPVTSVSGSIELSHVSFRYEENAPWVLRNLSLKIRAGEYVAIVGRTGCGKSTLVRLLLGFEKPQNGAVYYDGRDLDTIDPRSLRRKMGVVTQDGQLFQGDIFANITISAPQLTLEEAWEAAEIAGIAQDIRDMPMGMQTLISEGQGGVSGGQKQRIMIARAVAPKPKILIFDEATSALDNVTQKQVSDALDRLKCTRIVIAHRLSTIRHCDRILVLDGGRIVEEGNYEELIEKKGMFADLVARQRLEEE